MITVLKKINIFKISKVLVSSTIIFILFKQFKVKLYQLDLTQQLFHLGDNILLLIILILLMFFQIIIESMKWKFLIYKIQKIKTYESIKAIFSGLAISFITPNRTGNFLGRVLYINKGNRIKATLATIIGNYSQLLTTLSIGSISLLFLPNYMKINQFIDVVTYKFLIVATLFFVNGFFFSICKAQNILATLFNNKKFIKQIEILKNYKIKELLLVYFFSFLRHIIFLLQYYVTFQIFDIYLNLIDFFVLKTIFLLFVTILPSISLIEIGVRIGSAIAIFELVDKSINVVLPVTLIWIVNLVLPAMLGLFFFNKVRL